MLAYRRRRISSWYVRLYGLPDWADGAFNQASSEAMYDMVGWDVPWVALSRQSPGQLGVI